MLLLPPPLLGLVGYDWCTRKKVEKVSINLVARATENGQPVDSSALTSEHHRLRQVRVQVGSGGRRTLPPPPPMIAHGQSHTAIAG